MVGQKCLCTVLQCLLKLACKPWSILSPNTQCIPLYASSSGTPPLLKCDCQCWIIVNFNRGESAGVERTVFYLRHTMDVSFSHSFKMYLNLEKSLKANPQEHK